MREQAEQVNGMVVKLLTHDLLGGLSVEVAASTVRLRLPATREQLEALATLAFAMLPPGSSPPLPLPPPPPPPPPSSRAPHR